MKRKEPSVGVIIPVYKVKREYLLKCVKSVINQTYKNIKIFLVDDCSPDDCGKWCDSLAAHNPNICVFHHATNKKLPASRNTGLLHLNTDWVTFLDSDDWLDINTIEKVMDAIEQTEKKVDFAFFPMRKAYKNSESEQDFSKYYEFNKEDILQLQNNSISFAKKRNKDDLPMLSDSACGKVISVSFLRENNIIFRDFDYREDSIFYLEICQFANRSIAVPYGCYHYTETSGSMVNSFRKNSLSEQKKYYDGVIEFGKKFNKNNHFFKAIDYLFLVIIQNVIIQYFYNGSTRITHRNSKCYNYIREFNGKVILKRIEKKELNNHFLIKYLLIKYRLYYFVPLLRKIFKRVGNKEAYE